MVLKQEYTRDGFEAGIYKGWFLKKGYTRDGFEAGIYKGWF